MFVLNQNGHYFEINTKAVAVSRERFHDCRVFDDEKEMLEAVCQLDGLGLDEVEGSTFYITIRDDQTVLIDDRGFAHNVDEPVEAFISSYFL